MTALHTFLAVSAELMTDDRTATAFARDGGHCKPTVLHRPGGVRRDHGGEGDDWWQHGVTWREVAWGAVFLAILTFSAVVAIVGLCVVLGIAYDLLHGIIVG